MKKFLSNILIIIILSVIILISYAYLEGKLSGIQTSKIWEFFYRKNGETEGGKTGKKKTTEPYRAVWLTYLEFNAYRNSVKTNDEKSFTAYYQHVLDQCKKMKIGHIIVQVRPFGDALYESKYFPWASCISGHQGESPGYDPLRIMVNLTHKNNMRIEAWINPYRISSGDDTKELSKDNPAKIWLDKPDTSRNVLTYEHALYYNPSSKQVRTLIQDGIEEIVSQYDVDGIHMDDYFYPVFNEADYDKEFDSREYKAGIKNGDISQDMSIADWRRFNVNQLISGIYKRIKALDSSVTFGISPAGNPANLRSDLEYYADIDTWISKDGYIDYIMPQIYWGYTNEEAPFKKILKQWKELCHDSSVSLYVGLQLYRLGIDDRNLSDYEELQSSDVIKTQIKEIIKDPDVNGYCLFSFQYLDIDNEEYKYDSTQFSKKRKNILRDLENYLKTDTTLR